MTWCQIIFRGRWDNDLTPSLFSGFNHRPLFSAAIVCYLFCSAPLSAPREELLEDLVNRLPLSPWTRSPRGNIPGGPDPLCRPFFRVDRRRGDKVGKVGNVRSDTIRKSLPGKPLEQGSGFARARKKVAKWPTRCCPGRWPRQTGGLQARGTLSAVPWPPGSRRTHQPVRKGGLTPEAAPRLPFPCLPVRIPSLTASIPANSPGPLPGEPGCRFPCRGRA
jgi:hypothetical protein